MEYIKVLLHNGKMVGAILIGETDLEVSTLGPGTILLLHRGCPLYGVKLYCRGPVFVH